MSVVVAELQKRVAVVLPLMHANLNTAHNAWMAGSIPKGSFDYVLRRHWDAVKLTSEPADEFDEEQALAAGAALFIDLRSGLRDLPDDQRAAEELRVDALLAFYVQNGFTELHPEFGIPLRPAPRNSMERGNV